MDREKNNNNKCLRPRNRAQARLDRTHWTPGSLLDTSILFFFLVDAARRVPRNTARPTEAKSRARPITDDLRLTEPCIGRRGCSLPKKTSGYILHPRMHRLHRTNNGNREGKPSCMKKIKCKKITRYMKGAPGTRPHAALQHPGNPATRHSHPPQPPASHGSHTSGSIVICFHTTVDIYTLLICNSSPRSQQRKNKHPDGSNNWHKFNTRHILGIGCDQLISQKDGRSKMQNINYGSTPQQAERSLR